MILEGPLTVAAVERAADAVAQTSDLVFPTNRRVLLLQQVMQAIADGHPHSARLAKAALRAFDV